MAIDHSADVYIDPPYRVVHGLCSDLRAFEAIVNRLVGEGYRLHGGPVSDGNGRIYQALCREEGR